jgi:hypothetical protein
MNSFKIFFLSIIIATFTLIIYAGKNNPNDKNNTVEKISIAKYFPLNESIGLQYNSNFGKTNYTLIKSGEDYIQKFKSDDFFSAQSIKLIDNSIFLTSMEQEVDVLLFISHGIFVTYNEPALLLPLNLEIGEEWNWKGIEYIDERTDTVTISGKLTGFEVIDCEAGKFNCLRFDYEISKASGKLTRFTEWREENIGIVKLTADVSQKGFAGLMISLLGYDDIFFELEKINIL